MGSEIVNKSTVTITARDKWQKTGIWSTPLETIVVKRLSGYWHLSFFSKKCDADGTGEPAPDGYAHPGAGKGQLLGRIGDHVFPLGNQGKTPEGLEGELELCTNDALHWTNSFGYGDNWGEIEFELSLHRR